MALDLTVDFTADRTDRQDSDKEPLDLDVNFARRLPNETRCENFPEDCAFSIGHDDVDGAASEPFPELESCPRCGSDLEHREASTIGRGPRSG